MRRVSSLSVPLCARVGLSPGSNQFNAECSFDPHVEMLAHFPDKTPPTERWPQIDTLQFAMFARQNKNFKPPPTGLSPGPDVLCLLGQCADTKTEGPISPGYRRRLAPSLQQSSRTWEKCVPRCSEAALLAQDLAKPLGPSCNLSAV